MNSKHGVIVVGGGIIGISAAYRLAQLGKAVTVLDQFDVPNQWGASGDQLRVFRMTYGGDAFYTEMAVKSLPLWLELNHLVADKLLLQNGVLEFATSAHGYEEQSFKVLSEMRLPVVKLDKAELRQRYPMINTRAVKYGLFHKDGGMIWAMRATAALAGLAQRKGVKIRPHTRIAAVLRDRKLGIRGLKDSSGRLWEAESYVIAAGAWTPEVLKNDRLPLKVTRQEQLYLRPPINRGRYRPEHFPVFGSQSYGFYGYPLHIHGFMKIACDRKGPPGKPEAGDTRVLSPAFERKCRTFLKRFMPELAGFTEMEGHIGYYSSTPDGDCILDRLPGAPNAFVAAGFSGHGFKFAPLLGKTLAELVVGARPDLNLHRFRLSRFKR